MGRSTNVYYLCVVFSVWTVCVALKKTTTENSVSGVNVTKSLTQEEPKGAVVNLTTVSIDDAQIFPKICGRQKLQVLPRGRIIGGTKASLGEYPWLARLMHRDKRGHKSFGCSGFLIHSRYVITAGHCTHPHHTERRGPVFSVILGEHNTETKTDCTPGGTICADPIETRKIGKVITHPEYNPESLAHYNDIAIIYLKKRAIFSDFVQPICLPKDDSRVPAKYYLSGWGKTENEPSSKIKMKVEIGPFDKDECLQKYSFLSIELKDTQICAGGEKKKDACTGDSGGPLMTSSVNGTWYASGIVSYGIGCGMEGWPGVYTNLVKFLPWIKTQITLNSMLTIRSGSKKKGKKRHKKVKAVKAQTKTI